MGGSTAEAELNCAIMAGKTIRQFMETGEITNSVNFPNVHQALTAPYRITLIIKMCQTSWLKFQQLSRN